MTSSKVKRANSMDAVTFPPLTSHHHETRSGTAGTQRVSKGNGGGNMRKGMMAFFETFRNKQAATS